MTRKEIHYKQKRKPKPKTLNPYILLVHFLPDTTQPVGLSNNLMGENIGILTDTYIPVRKRNYESIRAYRNEVLNYLHQQKALAVPTTKQKPKKTPTMKPKVKHFKRSKNRFNLSQMDKSSKNTLATIIKLLIKGK